MLPILKVTEGKRERDGEKRDMRERNNQGVCRGSLPNYRALRQV
jgi:hypothetical protein